MVSSEKCVTESSPHCSIICDRLILCLSLKNIFKTELESNYLNNLKSVIELSNENI